MARFSPPTPNQLPPMVTLNLTLKKKWYDMILSGEKTEEYREIKDYWKCRLMIWPSSNFKHFDTIKFTNGYARNAPSFMIECKGIKIGTAKPLWSDNWQGDVFIISLGKIIA